MFRPATKTLLVMCWLVVCWLGLTACSGGSDDPDRTADRPAPGEETRVVFNPTSGDLPVPNDLLFARETAGDGTMNGGDDAGNPVVAGIDALDGNSVLSPIDVKFSGSLDTSQDLDARNFIASSGAVVPNPNQNVFLLPLTYPSGDPLSQAQADLNSDGELETAEVPTFAEALAYQRAAAANDEAALAALASPKARAEIISLNGGTNNVLRITPLEPLQPETKYLIVVTNAVRDAAGYSVYSSHAYNFIRDPESPFDADDATVARLRSLRTAINGWESLAAGYFGFMQSVYDNAGVDQNAPAAEDVVLSLTFTTGGTDAILKSIAAPEIFFEKSLRTDYKQDAITKLVEGTYNLTGDNTDLDNTTDGAINSTLNVLLTSPQLPNETPNPLYSEAIANAIAGGADYRALAADASVAYRLQVAAAEAAIQVHNSGSAEQGDQEPYVDIATEAAGTAVALAGGNPAGVSAAFPAPAPRTTNFFQEDPASSINPALQAPALIYQGEITLPSYQPVPADGDGSILKTGNWRAGELGGGAVTPPSDKITYRYPFPEKQADVTVPLLATLPDAATLANFNITKPENGWPVIIYAHGIGSERSSSLPMANALAFACVNAERDGPSGAPCFATLAIDQPLHGIAPAGSSVPGLVSVTDPNTTAPAGASADLTERHFDFTADAESNPVPMDYASGQGASGSLFINLTNFTNVRGNLQQMVVDLLNLNASLSTMDIDGDGEPNDIDPSQVYFIGYSLGAINGSAFVAVNNDPRVQASPFNDLPPVSAAALLNTGGGVARLLVNSPAFAPRVLTGLANASEELTQGRSGLETYLNVFQGVLDSVDVMNFASDIATNDSTGVLLTEIVGDGTDEHPSDGVIPNAADTRWGEENGPLYMVLDSGFVIEPFPAPLAGTEPVIAQFGATPSAEAEASEAPSILVTRFTEGSHATPVTAGNTDADPLTSGAVFAEMIRQITRFFAEGGNVTGSIVTDASVVESAE